MNDNQREEKVYEAEILNDSEEYFHKQCKKAKLAAVMCVFFGVFGIDKFIMQCNKAGLKVLMLTIITSLILGIARLIGFIPIVGPLVYYSTLLGYIVLNSLRAIYYLFVGIKMLFKEPKVIVLYYELYKTEV